MGTAINHLNVNTDSIETIVSCLNESGVVVVKGVLNDDILAKFNAEIDGAITSTKDGRVSMSPEHQFFFGEHTRHITGIAGKSRTFVDEILLHPLVLGLCDSILLPQCVNYRLNVAHILDRGPGSEQQLVHRDDDIYSYLPQPFPGQVMLASLFALNDFTADNGATRVIPGSHNWDPDRVGQEDELVAAEMPVGSVVFYLGRTLHGGGPNTTKNQRRRGMHLSYTLGWLRTEENNYLTTPLEVARQLPRKAQELLGYSAHNAFATGGGFLGTVDTRDPIDMINSGEI